MRVTHGYYLYDFFVLPTIRYERYCEARYLTIDWFKWYIGIQWEGKIYL